MYGTPPAPYPRRVVCLTAETTEIAFALGAGERVVGVPGTAHHPPEARDRPKVGGFTTFRLDRILGLEPELVLAFSDLQADVVRELVRAGVTVLVLNQRSLGEIFQAILVIGGALGRDASARGLVADIQDEIRQIREFSSVWPDRPRVYFEEWNAPLIAGIRWVSELIEVAGGQDIFPELRACERIRSGPPPPGHRPQAVQRWGGGLGGGGRFRLRERRDAGGRVVDPGEVVRRNPEIIVASWCGKPVDLDSISRRPGWDAIEAVRQGQVHELASEDILSPGPSILRGLRILHEIIQDYVAGTAGNRRT